MDGRRVPIRFGRTTVIAVAILAVVGGLGAGLGDGLLHLAPALVLFAALLARRYPGAHYVTRLVLEGRRRLRRRAPARIAASPRPRAHRPRGGLLLATALAERGPPALGLA